MASQYQHLVKTTTLFFKPIHSASLTDKLMIPRKFVKKYGDVFSDKVFLKLPNGEEWEVNLGRRDNGDVWLENGWREFAEYHSLFKGRLLVFGYDDSNSHRLNVLIMDIMTSEEIEYPSSNHHGVQGNKEACKEQRSKLPSEINEMVKQESPCGTRKNNPPLPCLLQQDADLYHTSKKCKAGSQGGRFSSKVLKVKGGVVKGNRGRAVERAKAFKSQYPSFMIVARPSYINASSQVAIPLEFASKFLVSKKSGQSTNLRTSNGRVWVTKFMTRKQGTKTKFELSTGRWKAFVKDNDLKVDDVCVFELIQGPTHDELDFQVSIFRNAPLSQGTAKHTVISEQGQKNKRVKIKTETGEFQVSPKKRKFTEATSFIQPSAHSFNSEKPFFKVTIGSSPHSQAVPLSFVRKYLKQGKHFVELQVRDRSMRVKLIIITRGSSDQRGFFSEGWAAFRRENDLQKGDSCFFELLNRDDIYFMKVSIFKHSSP